MIVHTRIGHDIFYEEYMMGYDVVRQDIRYETVLCDAM